MKNSEKKNGTHDWKFDGVYGTTKGTRTTQRCGKCRCATRVISENGFTTVKKSSSARQPCQS